MNWPNDFDYLVDRLVDGSISSRETDELLALLDADESLREVLRAELWLDQLLTKWETNQCDLAAVAQTEMSPDPESDSTDMTPGQPLTQMTLEDESRFWSDAVAERESQSPEPIDESLYARARLCERSARRAKSLPREKRRAWNVGDFFFCVRLALFFGFIAFLAWRGTGPRSDNPEVVFEAKGRIAEIVDVVWGKDSPKYKRGQYIDKGRLTLDEGLVKIVLDSGAELILEAPGSYTIADTMSCFCEQGKINAYIPATARGFEVNTTFAKFIDRGTAFVLDVSPEGVRTDVITGVVDVDYLRKERTKKTVYDTKPVSLVNLAAGEAFTVNKTLDATRTVAQPARYLDTKQFGKILSNYVVRRNDEYGKKRKETDTRPDLLARFELTVASRIAENTAARTRAICPGMSFSSCRETEGRQRDSRAVAFAGLDANGTFSLPGEYESMTLVISVRIDNLSNMGNVLMVADRYLHERGSPLWQLSRDGRLILHITGKRDDFVASISDRCFGREEYGTWCRFAVVMDGRRKTISHYKDGRPVSTTDWKQPMPILWGKTMVGNNIFRDKTASARFIDGAIDEIMLFDRALSPDEIARFEL